MPPILATVKTRATLGDDRRRVAQYFRGTSPGVTGVICSLPSVHFGLRRREHGVTVGRCSHSGVGVVDSGAGPQQWIQGATMTKSDLIDVLCETQKLPKGRAELLVHVIFDALEAALRRGERIEIRGFGSFELRSYRGYDGRNPRTGSAVEVRPKRLPFFKVGKELKERVNAGRTTAPRAAAKRAPISTDSEAAAPETTSVTAGGPVAANTDAEAPAVPANARASA